MIRVDWRYAEDFQHVAGTEQSRLVKPNGPVRVSLFAASDWRANARPFPHWPNPASRSVAATRSAEGAKCENLDPLASIAGTASTIAVVLPTPAAPRTAITLIAARQEVTHRRVLLPDSPSWSVMALRLERRAGAATAPHKVDERNFLCQHIERRASVRPSTLRTIISRAEFRQTLSASLPDPEAQASATTDTSTTDFSRTASRTRHRVKRPQ